jgi:hypothetical protein
LTPLVGERAGEAGSGRPDSSVVSAGSCEIAVA